MIQEPNNIDAIVALRPDSEFNFNVAGLDWLDEKTTKPTDEEIATKLAELKAATQYKIDRTTNGSKIYASFGDQLDMLYKDIVAGKLDTTGTWATHIKAVKDANPKP